MKNIKKTKQKILDALEGTKLIAGRVIWWGNEKIGVHFTKNGKKGYFTYIFLGDEDTSGIDECDYDEGNEEDIYQDIHDWVNENIKSEINVYYNGKKLRV